MDIFENALKKIRSLTVQTPEIFQSKVVELCANAGVAVVFVRELPKTGVSGATKWLTANKALIQLSLRYRTDDHLWFTFFHEAGHILKHGKRKIFLEMNTSCEKEEEEANKFSSDFLIPQDKYKSFIQAGAYKSKSGVRDFAQTLGIAPGIVVGRLQHDDYIKRSYFNELKRKLKWAEG